MEIYYKKLENLDYSIRRYFIDEFFGRHISHLAKEMRIIDIGGRKVGKHGYFNAEFYSPKVKFVNLDKTTCPDICCDAVNLPIKDESCDVVFLSEILEHVEYPGLALKEAHRILKKGGQAFICSPFMYHMHSDPIDFARYTDYWFENKLRKIGFHEIHIEKQGLYYSVIALMFKKWIETRANKTVAFRLLRRILLYPLILWYQKKAIYWDKLKENQDDQFISSCTTGLRIICKK